MAKIKDSAEKIQSKHFNWSLVAKQENRETVLTNFFLWES